MALRDAPVPEDYVRLATIHSSRGTEASRVVILDYASGVSPNEAHLRNSRVMTHIALSGGQIGTAIVAVDDSTNPHLTFLEELIKAYKATE
jgi:superfamily I DNA/RNA helicase